MASKPAVALIVAGSGSVSEAEVFDLLEDRFPESDYAEVGLVVPVDKDLYTDAVKFAVKWFGDEKAVIPVQTNGASLSRASAALGDEPPQKVEKFEDILDPAEFPDWDEVYFIVAIPDDDKDPDYELYAELVEAAQEKEIQVKDLAAGLDDVILVDEEEPEAEPEPPKEEKAPPGRRSRARQREAPEPDPVVTKEIAKITEEDPVARIREELVAGVKTTQSYAVQEALEVLSDVARVLEKWDEVVAVFDGKEVTYRSLTLRVRKVFDRLADDGKDQTPTTKAVENTASKDEDSGSTRGRGRPRTNFEIKQIFDEDENDWIPRPKGRLRKGTAWRTIHAETNEVLEEGEA